MSDHRDRAPAPTPRRRRRPTPASARPARRPAAPLSDDTRLAVEIRGLVERGDDGRGARALRRARRRPPAPRARASPISICATPPTPTRPCRTPSSRSSATSARIARRGRSRSGSRAFSSTAASIAARRARRRDRWFAPADEATGADEAAPAFGGRRDADPEARLLARERRARLAAAIDRLDGRQRTSSCCATTATARRAKSAR